MKKILLIEDDRALVNGLSTTLTQDGFEVQVSFSGSDGYSRALNESFDIILLDIRLPEMDGLEVCKELRLQKVSTPIIMLTSKIEEADKITGLETGADDYVTKPFSIKELTARINAVLRRNSVLSGETKILRVGNVVIDFVKMEATKNGNKIKLSATEYNILKYFCIHEGEVVSRSKFLDDVWGYDAYPTTRTVDNYILSLRKKIEDNPAAPDHLLTVHKIGYKFIRE